jgi:hypothetical protein
MVIISGNICRKVGGRLLIPCAVLFLCLTCGSCKLNRAYHFNHLDTISHSDSLVIKDYAVCWMDRDGLSLLPREVDADSVLQHFLTTLGKWYRVALDTTGADRCDRGLILSNPHFRYAKTDFNMIRSMAGDMHDVITIVPLINITHVDGTVATAGGFATGGYLATFLGIAIYAVLNGEIVFFWSGYQSNSARITEDFPIVNDTLWQRVVGEVMQDFTPGRLPGAEPWQGRKRKRR